MENEFNRKNKIIGCDNGTSNCNKYFKKLSKQAWYRASKKHSVLSRIILPTGWGELSSKKRSVCWVTLVYSKSSRSKAIPIKNLQLKQLNVKNIFSNVNKPNL